MRHIVWASLALAALGCGTPPNQRLLVTRTTDYMRALSFGFETGHPFDIAQLEQKFPELKGIVITAPQWVEEYQKQKEDMKLHGESLYTYPIPYSASVTIEVVGEETLTKTYTVPPSGGVHYPHLGRIQIAGFTPDELRIRLEQQLKRYLKKPEVLVHLNAVPYTTIGPDGQYTVRQSFGDANIIVIGASTSKVAATGSDTLISVVTLGGTGSGSNSEWRQIRVIRRDPRDPLHKARVIVCDLWDYVAKADVRQDIPLIAGDVVFVPIRWSTDDQWWEEWTNIKRYIGLPGDIKSTAGQIPLSAFQPNAK